ncbi:polysaccharide biosynthesis C-terminal domain-containing protein [Enterovibrio norvegicus]|uniref:oligosaccharide flippase family protein n=1 Tax=Enterovibrio norvegicus TaxID=188144 RepID=UPI0038999107
MFIKKTTVDLLLNYISLAVTASSGVLLNIAIVRLFDVSQLGYFNLIYSIFVVLSQLYVFGIHTYCLKECSSKETDKEKIIANGIVSVLMLSLFFSICIWLFSNLEINISILPYIYENVLPFCLSLTFFSINKVVLYSINGLSMMKSFAIFSSARSLLMLATLIFIGMFNEDLDFIYIFLISEFTLCFILLFFLSSEIFRFKSKSIFSMERIIDSFNFGRKCVWSGFSIELNSRVDVIVLSFFVSNAMVGIYSFASMLVEGIYQLFVVVKNNINPKLSKFFHEKKISLLRPFLFKIFISVFILTTLSSLMLYLLYPLVVDIFNLDKGLLEALPTLSVLLIFLSFSSGFLVHDQILNLMGYPLVSSRLFITAALTNVSLNFILIPNLGLIGAALSTGISWLFFSILLFVNTKKIISEFYI